MTVVVMDGTYETEHRGLLALPMQAVLPGAGHWHYSTYGLRVCSNVQLPELARARFAQRDLALRYVAEGNDILAGLGPHRTLAHRETNLGCDLSVLDTGRDLALHWERHCTFVVSRDGREITCQPAPGVGEGWVKATVYGIVLAFALHLQGIGNLHASAVVLPQGVVGFMADPGSGKSTVAAMLAARGFPFLTDDVLALQHQSDDYVAHPGFPYVSLSPQARACALRQTEAIVLPLNQDKQRVAVDGKWACFSSAAAPAKGLFVLGRSRNGSGVEVKRLPKMEALRTLLEHTNCLPLLPADVLRRHMGLLADLSGTVPVWRLQYPSGFEHLPRVIDRILAEAA